MSSTNEFLNLVTAGVMAGVFVGSLFIVRVLYKLLKAEFIKFKIKKYGEKIDSEKEG